MSRDRIGDQRDFVLSLDPTLVYSLSQLRISYEKRDGSQWKYYLAKLGRQTDPRVSFDMNPTSRQTLKALAGQGRLQHLIAAGARLHQAGWDGCIGMGQAPATGKARLHTFLATSLVGPAPRRTTCTCAAPRRRRRSRSPG